MSVLLLTTNPGIEDLVEHELRERASAAGVQISEVERRADGWPGRVRVHSPDNLEVLRDLTPGMCSIHHVMAPVWEGPLPDDPLPGLAAVARAQDWSEVLGHAATFRASCERHGSHPFGSPDVERWVGEAVDLGTDLKVKLKGWDVAVRCDVRDNRAFLAVQYTQRSVGHARLPRPYLRRTALKGTIAWAMVQLARADGDPQVVCDPFCGSGTVLQEAGLQLPGVRLIGGDSYAPHLAGVRQNLDCLGLSADSLWCGDARDLGTQVAEGSVDAIITNPPYGVRLGKHIDFAQLYLSVLRQFHAALRPGGRVVMLAMKRGTLNTALKRVGGPNSECPGFETVEVRIVETGGLHPGLFVLRRR